MVLERRTGSIAHRRTRCLRKITLAICQINAGEGGFGCYRRLYIRTVWSCMGAHMGAMATARCARSPCLYPCLFVDRDLDHARSALVVLIGMLQRYLRYVPYASTH